MDNGKWRMDNGKWRMDNGEWRMDNEGASEIALKKHASKNN